MNLERRLMGLASLSAAVALALGSTAIGAGPGAGSTGSGSGTGSGPAAGSAPTALTAAQRIVVRTLREYGQVSHRACDALRDLARRTSLRLTRMDNEGKTVDEMTAVATDAKAAADTRAAAAVDRINTIKANALTALANNAGTQEQIDKVNTKAQEAIDRINQCKTTSKTRIDEALTRVTTDPVPVP